MALLIMSIRLLRMMHWCSCCQLKKLENGNLRFSSDVTSKKQPFKLFYDVLSSPFLQAFQVTTADAPEIISKEFWACCLCSNRSVRFKMNNKKHISVILEISGRSLTDNDTKLHPPWSSFSLSSPNVSVIENKNTKKGNAMYYPRFTKLVVNFVMEKDPSIPRRNKVNWHFARDDPMFTTINVISRNEATQLYGAILPVALTNEDIRNSESYKEYYARASGTIPPKTKGSKKKANTDIITQQKPPTAPKEKKSGKAKLKTTELETISEADLTEAEQLKIITKRSRQETHSSHASGSGADEGTAGYQAEEMKLPEKNDVNETTQDDEDDDDHDDDEKVQDDDEHDIDETVQEDDDEEQTESR
ncbi:hypothetical protein Tco_0260860 [Tanacetum coccineum]